MPRVTLSFCFYPCVMCLTYSVTLSPAVVAKVREAQ